MTSTGQLSRKRAIIIPTLAVIEKPGHKTKADEMKLTINQFKALNHGKQTRVIFSKDGQELQHAQSHWSVTLLYHTMLAVSKVIDELKLPQMISILLNSKIMHLPRDGTRLWITSPSLPEEVNLSTILHSSWNHGTIIQKSQSPVKLWECQFCYTKCSINSTIICHTSQRKILNSKCPSKIWSEWQIKALSQRITSLERSSINPSQLRTSVAVSKMRKPSQSGCDGLAMQMLLHRSYRCK